MTEHTIDIEREAWLAERRLGIGGSDVAAVLGLDPYKTPVQLWREKLGKDDGEIGNPAACRRGNFLEDAVAERYASLVDVATVEKQVRHNDGGIRRGNQDMRVIDSEQRKRCVEIKTVRRSVWRREWGAPWSDEVPDRALCQGFWYGNLDNADVIDFAVVVIPDDPDKVIGCTAEEIVAISDFHIYQAARDEELEGNLIGMAATFWKDYVLANTAPPARTAEDVELLWARSLPDETLQADDKLFQLIRDYDRVGQEAKASYAERSRLRDKILVAAGPAEAILASDGLTPLITLKSQDRVAHEVKASTSRVLRFSKWWARVLERTTQQQEETE